MRPAGHPALLISVALAHLSAGPLQAPAQSFTGGYSFVLPVSDTSSASPFLPSFPRREIGEQDRITVSPDGHFAAGGERIRFFGTNLVADAAFPKPEECWFIAGRLRALGFNLVRLHHLDNGWSQSGSLFAGMPDTRHLAAPALDRLHRLVAALKANGIYVNVNLHVSRTFRRSDGVPDADSLRNFARGYTFFDPLLIYLQKEYARQLLTSVNPYTGRSFAEDPVTAGVEITNENSLYRLWCDDLLKPYAAGGVLPVRHQRLLDSLWGAFIASRYSGDSALAAAWDSGAGGSVSGLLPGEGIAAPPRRISVAESPGFTDARVRDMTAFYTGLEVSFYREMRRYLRDSLGVRAPVVGSNLTFTPPDLYARSGLDYTDNHAYWDHPSFPGVSWSPTDWRIMNLPMVLHPDGGTIGRLMNGIPLTGKPHTISEYNHPFPNLYQSEGPLFLAAYAAFHDVDGVMFYDHNSSADWTTDGINGFFDLHRNTPIMVLMPSLAMAYRSGAVAPAAQTILLDLSDDDVLLAPKRQGADWLGPPLISPALTLIHGVRTRSFGAALSNLAQVPSAGPPPYLSDTGELRWDPAGIFSVTTSSFAAVTGFPFAPAGAATDPLQITSSSGHATVAWISPQGQPLSSPGRSLLTVSTRAQNKGMVWDGITTVHDQWGAPPTEILPLTATLQLRIAADSLRLWPLDTLGLPQGGARSYLPATPGVFSIEIGQAADRTPWYGLEASLRGTMAVTGTSGRAATDLEPNFPNPFNSLTEIRYHLSESGVTRIALYDLLGREVAVLEEGWKEAGSHVLRLDASSSSSGVYVCRMTAGSFARSRTILLLR